MGKSRSSRQWAPWRDRLYRIIFETDTRAGKAFDVALLIFICASIAAVVLESMGDIRLKYRTLLYSLEWFFTILFTIEYALRIICVHQPKKYIFSFFGVVDLLAILPTYLSFFISGSQYLLVIRGIRLLRVFRVFKMVRYVQEAQVLLAALKSSRQKIVAFLGAVVSLIFIMSAIMYLVEGANNGFSSIPKSMYWTVVTLTTVGYGDIVPHTSLGRFIASCIMIMGYAIIAVPTGIVSAELTRTTQLNISTKSCSSCTRTGHDPDSVHCRFCGVKL